MQQERPRGGWRALHGRNLRTVSGFWFYIVNCDRSHGWERILDLMEKGTLVEARNILGKPSISREDFLSLLLVGENHSRPGIYLNHVVDVDGEDAIYVGSSIKSVKRQVREHEQSVWSSQNWTSKKPFHYSWIRAKPGRTTSFKVLAQFQDTTTPAWIIQLLESIFMIMFKSYTQNPEGSGGGGGCTSYLCALQDTFQLGLVEEIGGALCFGTMEYFPTADEAAIAPVFILIPIVGTIDSPSVPELLRESPILPPTNTEGLRVTREDKGANEDQVELIDGMELKYVDSITRLLWIYFNCTWRNWKPQSTTSLKNRSSGAVTARYTSRINSMKNTMAPLHCINALQTDSTATGLTPTTFKRSLVKQCEYDDRRKWELDFVKWLYAKHNEYLINHSKITEDDINGLGTFVESENQRDQDNEFSLWYMGRLDEFNQVVVQHKHRATATKRPSLSR